MGIHSIIAHPINAASNPSMKNYWDRAENKLYNKKTLSRIDSVNERFNGI